MKWTLALHKEPQSGREIQNTLTRRTKALRDYLVTPNTTLLVTTSITSYGLRGGVRCHQISPMYLKPTCAPRWVDTPTKRLLLVWDAHDIGDTQYGWRAYCHSEWILITKAPSETDIPYIVVISALAWLPSRPEALIWSTTTIIVDSCGS